MKTERTQIHFLYNVFLPLRPQILKSLLAVDRDGGAYFQLGEEGLQTGPSGPSLQGDRGQSFQYTASRTKNLENPTSRVVVKSPYTVQEFSLFPKPHSISVNSRYPIIPLQTLLNVYTAIRERLSEKVHATIPKGIVGGCVCSVLQRNLKEWHERPYVRKC